MSPFPFVAVGIALTIILLLIVAVVVYRRRGALPATDYRLFFILGITWLPIGIATDNPGLWSMGLVFLIASLANRKKWKKGGF